MSLAEIILVLLVGLMTIGGLSICWKVIIGLRAGERRFYPQIVFSRFWPYGYVILVVLVFFVTYWVVLQPMVERSMPGGEVWLSLGFGLLCAVVVIWILVPDVSRVGRQKKDDT